MRARWRPTYICPLTVTQRRTNLAEMDDVTFRISTSSVLHFLTLRPYYCVIDLFYCHKPSHSSQFVEHLNRTFVEKLSSSTSALALVCLSSHPPTFISAENVVQFTVQSNLPRSSLCLAKDRRHDLLMSVLHICISFS